MKYWSLLLWMFERVVWSLHTLEYEMNGALKPTAKAFAFLLIYLAASQIRNLQICGPPPCRQHVPEMEALHHSGSTTASQFSPHTQTQFKVFPRDRGCATHTFAETVAVIR